MNRGKITWVVCILAAIVLDIALINYQTDFKGDSKSIYVEVMAEETVEAQVYYDMDEASQGEPAETVSLGLAEEGVGKLDLSLPLEYQEYRIRLLGVKNAEQVTDIFYQYYYKKEPLQKICRMEEGEEGSIELLLSGEDLRKRLNETQRGFQKKMNLLFCVLLDVVLLILAGTGHRILWMLREMVKNYKMIFTLGKNDFKTRFAGSYLGIVWAFIQPVVTTLVYWFVFQVGLRSTPVNNFPFVLWLIAGLVPWFFFSEGWIGGTGSLTEYSYLVKKVVFNVSTIPLVKMVSALFVHLFFVAFMLVLYSCYGYYPNIYWIQLIYYSFCMVVMVGALSYLSSAIMVFFRDLAQVINIALQVGIWVTGIMWSVDMLPERFRWLLYFNPMYYVVEGYRRALVSKEWFWEIPYQTIGFWIFAVLILDFGIYIFHKLRVHFADVL